MGFMGFIRFRVQVFGVWDLTLMVNGSESPKTLNPQGSYCGYGLSKGRFGL